MINSSLLNYPQINSFIEMNHSNENIKIYEGGFYLKHDNYENINIKGSIIFKWLPSPHVRFEGSADISIESFMELFFKNTSKIITHDGWEIGAGVLTSFKCTGYFSLTGRIQDFTKSTSLYDHIFFEVVNLRDFIGETVIKNNSFHKNRMILCNEEFEIVIDRRIDKKEFEAELKDDGGFAILCSGKIVSKTSKQLTIDEWDKVFNYLTIFLYFFNGRRCSIMFRKGVNDNRDWIDYTPYYTDDYKFVQTWANYKNLIGINELWIKFYELCKDDSDYDCLSTIIHWYVEANSNSGFVEGSISMIQNSLELLFNWIIVEKLNYINQNDAEKISASGKVGVLLSHFGLNVGIPGTLLNLTQFAKGENIKNGPEAFTFIRNKIVHPKKQNRDNLNKIVDNAKYESLQLGISYVENILLKYLEFQENYKSNRY